MPSTERRRPGFTLLEALAAVLVLGLVTTASLKLASISQRALSDVREREALMREAAKIQIAVAMDPLDVMGSSGDIKWETSEKSSPMFAEGDIDISKMGFENESAAALKNLASQTRRWREVEVSRRGKSITLFVPPKTESGARSDDAKEDVVSEDKS